MADLKKTIEILFEGNDQASRKASDVIAKIKELETQAGTTAPKVDNVSKSLDKIGAPAQITAMQGASAALAAFASQQVISKFIDANVEVERFEKGIRALKGAGTDTEKELDYIKNAANRMGLEVGPAAAAFLKLTAAAKGTESEGSVKGLFEAVSTAIKATGGSSKEAEGAFLALGQMMSKGKVTAEELRGQLAERLPGAMTLAANAMGLPVAELGKLVEKGLSAEEFIPRFTAQLQKEFGGTNFEGYETSLNRLRNSIDGLFQSAGKGGAFDVLIAGIKAIDSTLSGATAVTKFFGETAGAFFALLASANTADKGIFGADWKGFGENVGEALDKAARSVKPLEEAFKSASGEAEKLKEAAKKVEAELKDNQSDAETSRLKRYEKQAIDAEKEAGKLNKLLKELGVDPKKTDEGIANIAGKLKELANNPESNGTNFVLAVEASLKKVATSEQLTTIKTAVEDLFKDGKIDAATYEKALADIDKAGAKLAGGDGGLKKSEKAAEDAAKAMAKAEADAKAWALEMEKIASNERIKIIEAKVQIDIANMQEQTKRIEAAFQSIDNTVNSTGQTITDLFGLVGDLEGLDKLRLFDQIEEENRRRDEALKLQKELTEAQIAQMRAQTEAMNRGDSLITIQGDGLKPHLEAFMWEILKAIQVRVNADGLKLLLGT